MGGTQVPLGLHLVHYSLTTHVYRKAARLPAGMPRVLNRFGYCHVGARCNGVSYFNPCIFIVLTAFIVPPVVAVTTTCRPQLPPSI